MSDARVQNIVLAIEREEQRLRVRHGWLAHQNAVGLAVVALGVGTFGASSWGFLTGRVPAWLCVVLNALAMSWLREVEHDLIHNLFFARQPRVKRALMALLWPFLGAVPNPFFRREMHLLHHRASGTVEDYEERILGNGMRWGPLKVLASLEPGFASLFRHSELRQMAFYQPTRAVRAMFPFGLMYLALLHAGLAWGALWLTGWQMPAGFQDVGRVLWPLWVLLVMPAYLRQACLSVISSNMHYAGDVPGALHETQVVNAWWLFPMNLFCANFGSTHAIHHFVVGQPFYIRQLVRRAAHQAMRAEGVRFNDGASVLRGNRWNRTP